jgi:HemY protein
VAQAAIDARELAVARSALAPLVAGQPTVRVCLLMADLAELDGGDQGATRYWLARAARAPADRAWMADGVASDRWLPVSPHTGRLDAFAWGSPPDRLTQGDAGHEPPVAAIVEAPAPAPQASPTPSTAASEPAAATKPADAERRPEPGPPAAAATAAPAPSARPTPVIFPVAHAPDDPGAAAERSSARRWGAFNG